ncbi:MAG: hypothetical protein D6739_02465, partial [Nitrospirae bacterium]
MRRPGRRFLGLALLRDRGLVQEVVAGPDGVRSEGRSAGFRLDPEAGPGAMGAALAACLSEGRWRSRRVAAAVASHHCDHWQCELPPLKGRALGRLVAREVAARAEAGPPPAWGYEACEASGDGRKPVVVTTVDPEVAAAVEAGIRGAGFRPEGLVTSQVAGLARLRVPDQLEGLGVVAQVTFGRHETAFVALEEGRLLFSRTLQRGIEPEAEPEGRQGPTPAEVEQIERLATEIRRTLLYVKRELRRPVEMAVLGGVPRSWEWFKEEMRRRLDLPLGWESLPPGSGAADRCEESLRLLARGAVLALFLPRTLDLLPERTFDERHPRAGLAAAAAGLLLWAGAGWLGYGHLSRIRAALGADGAARARLEGRV